MSFWTRVNRKLSLFVLRIITYTVAIFRPKNVPIGQSLASKICIQMEIDAVLSKQFQDAASKQKKAFHWGDIGWQVENAAKQCAQILIWPNAENKEQYFSRVIPAISDLASSYRHSKLDESGYALGTVREIEKVLFQLSSHY
jgi:hypothetical protein